MQRLHRETVTLATHCAKRIVKKRIITRTQANTSDITIPVFVSESSAIGADPKLSQELTKLLFDLTAFQDPLVANAFPSTETVTIINSWIIKTRHFANVLEWTPCNKRLIKDHFKKCSEVLSFAAILCRSESTMCFPDTRALTFAAKPLALPCAEARLRPQWSFRPAYWSTSSSDELRHENGASKAEHWREKHKAKCRDRN